MDNREEFYENDQDVIVEKEALIEEAKKLDAIEDRNEAMAQVRNLQRRWRALYFCDSYLEEQLNQEFDSLVDAIYAKHRQYYDDNKNAKLELIAQAEKASKSDNFKHGSEVMADLMNKWKEIKTAGRDVDNELWEKFNAARQVFFDRKQKHYQNVVANFEKAKEIKELLIKEAKEVASIENFNEGSEKMRDLMKRWKEAGSAGKDHEEALWAQFSEHNQAFYDRRKAYYEELRQKQNEHYTLKQDLVAQAQDILDSNDFTRANTQAMVELGKRWKGIGFAGKDKEEEIYAEFRAINDEYFARLKQYQEEREANFHQRLIDSRSRKQDMINNQKRQIQRLNQDLIGVYSEREEKEIKEEIADKEAFIKELEVQIAELDAKISEQ